MLYLRELENLSGGILTYEEFVEYLNDYYYNPEEYAIDTESTYYVAIEEAICDPETAYVEYQKLFD